MCHTDPKHLHVFIGDGRFQSPGFPNATPTQTPTSVGYPAGVSYGWLITSVGAARADMTVTFHEFDLEEALRCFQADYVVVYRGEKEGETNMKWTQVLLFRVFLKFVRTALSFRIILYFIIRFHLCNDHIIFPNYI